MPGIGGHYTHVDGNHPVHLASQDPPIGQQPFYSQAPSATFYPANSAARQATAAQDAAYANPQAPISPPYSQSNQTNMSSAPTTTSHRPPSQMHQFGGPLFDPSDPALFNFDISSLNFGSHYGALELGMLGHMSSGAAETVASENPLNQAANLFNPQMGAGGYAESHGMPAHLSFGPDGLATAEWQNAHSRHGSLQIQTPNNTPITTTIDHAGGRHDSLNGAHAYAIGQGPSSLSSASPSSTDVNSGHDNDNPVSATYLANAKQNQAHSQPSATASLLQEHRLPVAGGPFHHAARRQRQEKSVYERTTAPHDYVNAFHRLCKILQTQYSAPYRKRAYTALVRFRPGLLSGASHLDVEDLIHTEKNLQRSLITMRQSFAEVGTPSLICRRSGEVVGMNKEFEILTGWKREVLVGILPNLNVNRGTIGNQTDDGELGNQTNVSPDMPGQEPDSGSHPVNILELMDVPSGVQYLEDFAELAFDDPLGKGHRRVNILRYLTKEDMAQMADRAAGIGKPEPLVKQENGSIHQGEAAMRSLGANGLIDSMIMWHVKRDTFENPMLVAMQVSHY